MHPYMKFIICTIRSLLSNSATYYKNEGKKAIFFHNWTENWDDTAKNTDKISRTLHYEVIK